MVACIAIPTKWGDKPFAKIFVSFGHSLESACTWVHVDLAKILVTYTEFGQTWSRPLSKCLE